ncbi:MAG: ABC transporter ATP-binding protein [Ilumatobacteraceae bacterium]
MTAGTGEREDVLGAVPAEQRSGWPLLRAVLATQRRGLILGVVAGLLWGAGKVAVPTLTRLAIDHGIIGHESLWFWAAMIAAAAVVIGICTGWRRWLAFNESRLTETRLRDQLFEHYVRLHVGFHDRTQTGQLMSRASSDLMQIQAFVVMIPLTISNMAMVAAVVVLLLTAQPLLAVVALAPLPLVNVLAQRFSRRIHPAVLAVQAEQAELATVVEESVSGVRVIKGFGAEEVQAAKLGVEADDIQRVSLDAARIRSAFLPALDLLPNLGLIAVLGIGGHRVIAGEMTYGQMVEFLQYIALLIVPLRSIGMTVAFGQRAAAALIRVDEVLRTEPAVADPAQAHPLPDTPPLGAVRFRDVSFGYQRSAPVLDGFDLDVAAGESVALVGATGSGKSTVARLLTRFYDVDEGRIELDGVELSTLALGDLRHAVAVVFEDTFLFNDTVRGNIAFARPDAPLDEVQRCARLAGAAEFVEAMPDGYDTMIGERGFSLSGGQRQRIAIARAILVDPRVLVLDDATSAVDPSKEHEIREAMATVMRGRTTIVIAHRPGTIALASSVVLLDGGRVAARGTHDELLATSERYRDVLAAWAARDDDETERDGDHVPTIDALDADIVFERELVHEVDDAFELGDVGSRGDGERGDGEEPSHRGEQPKRAQRAEASRRPSGQRAAASRRPTGTSR